MSWLQLVPQMIRAGLDAFHALKMGPMTGVLKEKDKKLKPVPQTSQTRKMFGDGFFANPMRAML